MNATGAAEPLPGLAPQKEATPSFNLWSEPWIGVLRPDGEREEVGIAECLMRAHEFAALSDRSPLVVAATQRLLAAVAQAIFDPQELADLADLLDAGRFDSAWVAAFGKEWAGRFDLFSPDRPFLQTGDAPPAPARGDKPKTVAYLLPEVPSGTAVVHFRHAYDGDQRLCPACAAAGLVTLPAFATSGGAGIKPSINGVPPLYILPAGDSLFEALALSLIVPAYQPRVRTTEDAPAWAGPGHISRGKELDAVGYLQSLTFPARRVRLYPQHLVGHCTRCGRTNLVLVSEMLFEMGHSRPKDAPFWSDPFAAYQRRGDKTPVPVRPREGRALWREYASLFLTAATPDAGTERPAVLEQLAALRDYAALLPSRALAFRCVGMRTDMKAKVFEWIDAVLDVPLGLLGNPRGEGIVRAAIDHAEECAGDLRQLFAQAFRPDSGGKRDRYQPVRARMEATYWTDLAGPFREFVVAVADPARAEVTEGFWVERVLRTGRATFEEAVDAVGSRGEELRRRAQALHNLTLRLAKRRKEWLQ
jgi:CRISPR system Cascade subunit CasA